MVVVNPEAPEPGEAVDGVAGPEIQKVQVILFEIDCAIFYTKFEQTG